MCKEGRGTKSPISSDEHHNRDKRVIKLEYLLAPECQHILAHHQNRHAGTAATHTHQDNVWHMGRHAWSVARLATSEKYVGKGGPGL